MNSKTSSLDVIFNPRSIAVVGASPGKSGQLFLDSIVACGFKGPIYPVNPAGTEVSGMKAFSSLPEIGKQVDYVVCCIPAPAVPQLVRDCATAGVKAMQAYTSGFSESGSDEGRQLEAEVVRLAREAGIRLIGPNCLGAYSPSAGLSFATDFPRNEGKVALLGQSGGNTSYLIRASAQRGVRFSKAVSYGNAADVDECDLLEYLRQDQATEAIGIYIEGVKNGGRFYDVLSNTARTKPVLVLKGGYTEAGSETAASHTGSLAGSAIVWHSLIRQAGAIRVYTPEQMVDMLVTFSLFPKPRGRCVGVFGGGGGASVMATDELSAAGFQLPRPPKSIRRQLGNLFGNSAGMIFKNPIDISSVGFSNEFYDVVRRALTYGEEEWIDFALLHAGFGQAAWFSAEAFEKDIDRFHEFISRLHNEIDKPMALVLQFLVTNWEWQKAISVERGCSEAGLPVYHSMPSVALALHRFMRYHEKAEARAARPS